MSICLTLCTLWPSLHVAAAQPVSDVALDLPTDHTLVYYNARMALREGKSLEAFKLWLLRNSLEDQTGQVSVHDPDFHSVAWVALGELGLCQDGHPTDDDGAGLWPLGLHNWAVRNMGRSSKGNRPRPFEAFEVGRQQRFVSVGDVLGASELKAVRVFRGPCLRHLAPLVAAGESLTADLSDRQVSARLLRHLLVRARTTLAHERVRGMAVIEARLFDVDLVLTALAARAARQKERQDARKGRQIGLSRESVSQMREDAEDYSFSPRSEAATILRRSVNWPVLEWMALSPDRRVFLFDHARNFGGDPARMRAIALGIVDQLVVDKEGDEVERWIARAAGDDPEHRRAVWEGARGQGLLALDAETGFEERSVIALHRGVHDLAQGDLPSALRAMAYALQHAHESRASQDAQNLSRRWLSYIASQFELTDELLVTLQALVPRRDYSVLLEDLMWRAAFHADRASFDRGVEHQLGRGALERRIELLGPLASGSLGRFSTQIRTGLDESPSETLRFLDQFVQRLELEDGGIRTAQLSTVRQLRTLLRPMSVVDGRQGNTAGELMARLAAISEGVAGLEPDARASDWARVLAPDGEVFAGSVRLAPSDPLPWPFVSTEVTAPSVFVPMDLTPLEWRNSRGQLVFGWSIGG